MRPNSAYRLTLPTLALGLLLGCGDEPAQIAPEQRCAEEGLSAYLDATLEGPERTIRHDLARPAITGAIDVRGISVNLGARPIPGQADQADLILNFFDSSSAQNMLDTLSQRTTSAPLILQVIDATAEVTGSQGRTDLERFDCSVADDTICVQLGYDVNGDEVLGDQDHFVYHGSGGTLTVVGFDNREKTMEANFQVSLGQNMLGFEDTTTGEARGCLLPNYALGSGGRYPLQ
ncbi:hypothetical protein [Lujinxingia litoralis]|nr:hypothetical protein [Lujinxingia litoralis]